MDFYQLKTFVTVAREQSITRASALLHLSQPAVSAHIKAMEESLGVTLFERTARGMILTTAGQRLLAKAEQTLAAHEELLAEASRSKGELRGKLRIGASSNSVNHEAVGKLLTKLAARWPGIEVTLKHASSKEIREGLRNGTLDAGFYNDPSPPEQELSAVELTSFSVFVVAAPELTPRMKDPDWKALAAHAWIYPTESACCNRTAEALFSAHRFRPARIISADRQELTRTLLAGGVGVGLLHADTARAASDAKEVVLLFEAPTPVHVYFAHLATRESDPVLHAAMSIFRNKSL